MDPWEKFQALKAADKLTMMNGKLRESSRWTDQLNLDPWEKFQALKAADKLTMMKDKLRESTRWTDQLNLDPWEKFQAIKAADKLTAMSSESIRRTDQLKLDPWERFQALKAADILTRTGGKFRHSIRGTNQPNSDIDRQKERQDLKMTSTTNDDLAKPFACSRRPVSTPDHVTSLGYTGVYQPRLSTLFSSDNFARETSRHTLQEQRLRVPQILYGSRGPFCDVDDWFASKYGRAPKQEPCKSSAQGRTTTQDILGVYLISYGAQDFTDSSSKSRLQIQLMWNQ